MNRIPNWLRYVTVIGNVVFIFWLARNGIDDGLRATWPEIASYLGLAVLLLVNSFLVMAGAHGTNDR